MRHSQRVVIQRHSPRDRDKRSANAQHRLRHDV